MSMSKEDCAEYIRDRKGMHQLTEQVPGQAITGGLTFSNYDDAVSAVLVAFAAWRSGQWQKQEEVRRALGIRNP